jgi:hypothetical protein
VIPGECQITKEVDTFDCHIINWFRMRTGKREGKIFNERVGTLVEREGVTSQTSRESKLCRESLIDCLRVWLYKHKFKVTKYRKKC